MYYILSYLLCLFVDNAVDWLSGHMKGRYSKMRLRKCKEEKDPWPPMKTKSYVTLALVHQKELQTRQETTATINLLTKGHIHKIPHTIDAKKLEDIAQIFDKVSGIIPNSILIEGHPGIGKTTLAKQICVEWTEGNLLTSDKLVLLLLLRDPNVQKINNEHRLIEHFTKSTSKVEQLYSYLEDEHGTGVTLIIDGFDELNTELRSDSFFRELIEKRSLPEAKIVVTSKPSASACLHNVVDKRIEILGFEQSSKNQYITEASQDSSQLEKLQRHFQQYPNIDAICYIPLIMSIIVFLCMCQPDELPPTATKMYASFILHIICHYLKRAGKVPEDKIINKLEHLPPVVYRALQDLQKTAYDGLEKDKIVFTVEELPEDDRTCYGLLQSTECYSAEAIGSSTQLFNFLHLGIQEYFAAKYVTTLPENEVYMLLKESFIGNHDSKSVRLSNMWILYCGITSGQCKTLRHYLTTYGKPGHHTLPTTTTSSTDLQVTSEKAIDLSQQRLSSDQRVLNTETISQDILKDPVKVLYLFQCFQEAQDSVLCKVLSESFDDGVINISRHRLLPHQVVSLGFFLSRSHRKWKELNLSNCHIGDHGMSILHQYLCLDKANKLEITKLNVINNDLSGASSHLIADIISHLQPHTVVLHYNNITNVRDISIAVNTIYTVKVLHMWENDLTAQEAAAMSNLMMYLEELDIRTNKFGNHGVELLSEGLINTKTLRVLYISKNNIGPSGITVIANALSKNISLEKLYVWDDNFIEQDAAKALGRAIIDNKTLKKLALCQCYEKNDISFYNLVAHPIDKESAMIIIKSLYNNTTIAELCLDITLCKDDITLVTKEAEMVNSIKKSHNEHIIDFILRFTDPQLNPCGHYTTEETLSW